MSIEQARRHWHRGIAVGKLNVVHAEGKEPHLLLDSAVCGVNPKCNIPERISLPMASDMRLACVPEDTRASFIGASFDFKAAHKQIQVRPSEHGLLLFRFANTLYHYRVCHFGARFSAYWWQRTGAFLLRLLHGVLSSHPHRAWLFVDDLLAALRRLDARQQLALMVIFFAAISAPISWKKVWNCLTWCGWSINFSLETIELTPLKILKLKEQLSALLRPKRVKRKLLEQVLELLIWATSLSLELRSWLAPLYADLHSPPGCMISVHARLWPAFLSALTAKAVLALPVRGVFMPPQHAAPPTCLASCPVIDQHGCASPTQLPSTFAYLQQAGLTLNGSCNVFRQIWHARCEASQSWHAKQPPMLAPRAPKSAQVAGLYPAAPSHGSQKPGSSKKSSSQWPFLTKEAQRYIACFETLAQLALMRIAWTAEGQAVRGLRMPSRSRREQTVHYSMAIADFCAMSRRMGL